MIRNERIKLWATACSNLGVGCLIAGAVAPMVTGQIHVLPSVVAWTLIGLDFISLALMWLGRLQ